MTADELVAEIVRRVERAHGDRKLSTWRGSKGLAMSDSARMCAHLADLALLTGRQFDALYPLMTAGRLATELGLKPDYKIGRCTVCKQVNNVGMARVHTPYQEANVCIGDCPAPNDNDEADERVAS